MNRAVHVFTLFYKKSSDFALTTVTQLKGVDDLGIDGPDAAVFSVPPLNQDGVTAVQTL